MEPFQSRNISLHIITALEARTTEFRFTWLFLGRNKRRGRVSAFILSPVLYWLLAREATSARLPVNAFTSRWIYFNNFESIKTFVRRNNVFIHFRYILKFLARHGRLIKLTSKPIIIFHRRIRSSFYERFPITPRNFKDSHFIKQQSTQNRFSMELRRIFFIISNVWRLLLIV